MESIPVSVHPRESLVTAERLIALAKHLPQLDRDTWIRRARHEGAHLRSLYAEGNRRLAQPINESQRAQIKQLQSELLWAEQRLEQTIMAVMPMNVQVLPAASPAPLQLTPVAAAPSRPRLAYHLGQIVGVGLGTVGCLVRITILIGIIGGLVQCINRQANACTGDDYRYYNSLKPIAASVKPNWDAVYALIYTSADGSGTTLEWQLEMAQQIGNLKYHANQLRSLQPSARFKAGHDQMVITMDYSISALDNMLSALSTGDIARASQMYYDINQQSDSSKKALALIVEAKCVG